MSSPNGREVFEVRMSGLIAAQVKTMINTSPRKEEIIESLKRIQDKLAHDPWNFGEQEYHHYHKRMQIRLAVVGPVAVEYAVEMDRPRVIIKRFVELVDD